MCCSPAEPYKICTTLTTLNRNLLPKWPNTSLKKNVAAKKKKQAYYYNQHHGVQNLTLPYPGDQVLTKLDTQKSWTKVVVKKRTVTPRSYLPETHYHKTEATSRLLCFPVGLSKCITALPNKPPALFTRL